MGAPLLVASEVLSLTERKIVENLTRAKDLIVQTLTNILSTINSPDDVKAVAENLLPQLAQEVRDESARYDSVQAAETAVFIADPRLSLELDATRIGMLSAAAQSVRPAWGFPPGVSPASKPLLRSTLLGRAPPLA